MEEEVGRVKKNATTDIVVKVDDYGGEKGVTIREFVSSETYTGFTKQGTRINKANWAKFKELIDQVKLE
jgi:hypothetical protein